MHGKNILSKNYISTPREHGDRLPPSILWSLMPKNGFSFRELKGCLVRSGRMST